jgi:uncharacterized protein
LRFTDEKLRLVCPTPEYEARAREFIEEFARFSSELNGTGGLAPFLEKNDYEGWLRKLAADLDLANIPEGRVPAITYFYVRERDGRVVGMVNIRLEDNGFIRNEAGHVGYCIRPTERRKHYASQLLADALEVCRRMRIERVVVTCDRENVASAKTIESCGGVPEAELWSETFRETIRRYVILPPVPAAEEQDSGENSPEDDPLIRAAVDYIAELFWGDSGGHDAEHSLRVFRSARRIAAGEGNCDPTVVALAALLHDADDHKLFHTEQNANARAFLEREGLPEETVGRICAAINAVSFSQNRGRRPETPEGRAVQDADRLDALGAIGIARTFAYGGARGRSLEESVQHFYDKLLLLRGGLNTETARVMAGERHTFLEAFLEEWNRETGGGGK